MMKQMRSQVVVAGGGPAGVSAALASARLGRETVLATNRPTLGGNSSSEIRLWPRGATGGGSLFAEETGIWGGLKMKNLYANPDFNPYIWDDVLLDACVSEPKLTLLLNAHARYAEMDGGRIKFLKVTQLTTEAEIDIYGDVFIDCTGDGSIAASAGVPFIIGGEESNGSSSSFPVKTQGNSILYSTRDTGKPTRFVVPSYAHSIDHIERLLKDRK
ncbi:MAG: FAD-dependent oxidoreductase, partial [Clostridiales bacterium]|nr:FAD-dependent oxidoreductase [Clostridiales bacterium]